MQNTVKPVSCGLSKIDKTKVIKTDGCLMKVENIADSVILLTSLRDNRS